MLICMIIATVSVLAFSYLFLTAGREQTARLLIANKEIIEENVKKNTLEMTTIAEYLKQTKNKNDKVRIKRLKELKKQNDAAAKKMDTLKKGRISPLDLIPLAGYRVLDLMKWEDAANDTVRKLTMKCMQFKEKAQAVNYTFYLLASLIGYLVLGVAVFFILLGVTLAMGLGLRGAVISLIGFVLFFIIGYVPYDNVNVVIKERAEEIESQFPQVVSKLALLTVAGMEVNQAWKLTCSGSTGVLYEEMHRVIIDLDHNVAPVEAYTKFINRCNNNYTTKLATAILQNTARGNDKIVELLRSLNSESWMEHKHNARRKGEAIQSKLMIPTLLMFLGIIVMIIIPILSGFNL